MVGSMMGIQVPVRVRIGLNATQIANEICLGFGETDGFVRPRNGPDQQALRDKK